VRGAPAAPTASSPVRAQPRDTQLASAVAARPDQVKSTAAPKVNTDFALLGPFGDVVSATRPEFSWQPLAGAVRYSVTIVDTGLHPVQRSPRLRKTVWRPRRPLRRGHSYLWQVTATLRNGTKVVASQPSPSGTLLRIVPLNPANP